MKNVITLTTQIFLAFTFLFLAYHAKSQMSYEEYKASYSPHYDKLTPDANIVKKVNTAELSVGIAVIKLLIGKLEENSKDEENKLKLVAILTSCDRKVIADILNSSTSGNAVKALQWLKEDWIRELVWFVEKSTYHNIAPHLTAITDWKGSTGPFGPELNNWSLAYAGVGYDRSWGGYKAFNEYFDAYNSVSQKLTEDLQPISQDIPLNKMGTTNGFGLFGALYNKNRGFLQFDYQNRSAKSVGGGESPFWERTYRYSSNALNISFLVPSDFNSSFFKFYYGWGIHGLMGNMQKKLNFNGTESDYEKIGSGFTAGMNYNVGAFINPVKNFPVMLGVKAYAQINLLRHNAEFLEDDVPYFDITGANEPTLKSVNNLFGLQIQAIYKFGKTKKDNSQYPSFEEELVNNSDQSLNTAYSEVTPRISPDGKTLYFIRADHPLNTNGSLNSQDIWVADVSNGIENATARHLEAPFNKSVYNSVAGVSPDENTLMIKGFYKNGERTGRGYSFMYRTENGWSEPEGIEIDGYSTMPKGDFVGQYWSQDGKHLLLSFSENADDNSQDLYVSHLKEDGTWARPINLGNTINGTKTDDHSPFLASDGKTLYYSSNREGGIGNNDIWFSKRLDDTWTNWSEPENAGSDINTELWDAYYSIDASGKYAYMSSSKNSIGKEDIVKIKLKDEVQPDPVTLITGRVLDSKTNKPIAATIAYNNLNDGKNYGVARTNPKTGAYKIVLPYGINYDFNANAKDYIGVSENLDLTDVGEYKEIERDLFLVPIEVGSTVRLNNIFFETGSATLKPESFSELNRVVEFMENNPSVKIELGGHTDNVGNDDFNMKLSQDRVNSVLSYLKSKNVDESRIVAKGYGESKPIADNDTEEGKQKNRRVQFIILER